MRHDDGSVRRFDHFNGGRRKEEGGGGGGGRERSGLCVSFRNVCVRNVTATSGAERDHMISSRLAKAALSPFAPPLPFSTTTRFIRTRSVPPIRDAASSREFGTSSRRNAQRTRKNGMDGWYTAGGEGKGARGWKWRTREGSKAAGKEIGARLRWPERERERERERDDTRERKRRVERVSG